MISKKPSVPCIFLSKESPLLLKEKIPTTNTSNRVAQIAPFSLFVGAIGLIRTAASSGEFKLSWLQNTMLPCKQTVCFVIFFCGLHKLKTTIRVSIIFSRSSASGDAKLSINNELHCVQ